MAPRVRRSFQVPGELSTTSTGALCLPVSRIYYTTVSPFVDLPPLNTGNGPENRYRDLARPPSCCVPKRFRLHLLNENAIEQSRFLFCANEPINVDARSP